MGVSDQLVKGTLAARMLCYVSTEPLTLWPIIGRAKSVEKHGHYFMNIPNKAGNFSFGSPIPGGFFSITQNHILKYPTTSNFQQHNENYKNIIVRVKIMRAYTA